MAARGFLSRLGEKERFALLLIAPAATVLVLFQVVPIVIGANASFRDWQLYDPKETWIGLAHYRYILTDPVFLTLELPNTIPPPQVIAPVIAATSMRWAFNDQFGVIAAFLRAIGYGQISWLAER